ETEPKEIPVGELEEPDEAAADVDEDADEDEGDDGEDEDEDADEQSDSDATAKEPRAKRPAPSYDDDVESALKALRKGSLPKTHAALVHLRLGLRDRAEELARAA